MWASHLHCSAVLTSKVADWTTKLTGFGSLEVGLNEVVPMLDMKSEWEPGMLLLCIGVEPLELSPTGPNHLSLTRFLRLN